MDRGFGRVAVGCAVAVGLVASGCGGSGGGVKEPKAAEPISAVVPKFNKALADQSCAEFAALDFSLNRQNTTPGAPPTGSECKSFFTSLLAMNKAARYDKSAAYGTAAFIEGPVPKSMSKGAPADGRLLALFVLDRDGRFRFIFSQVTDRQIGTKPNAQANDHGKNAQAVVDAVRSGSCAKLAPLIHSGGALAHSYGGKVQAACKAVVDGKIFAPSVKATKDVKPVLLGATRDFQFYGVSTKRSYFTLVMATPPGTSSKPPLLFDEFPNTDNPAIPKGQKG